MNVHAYTEDQLVEQPAIGLFAELGWAVAGPPPRAGAVGEPRDAGLLGRETKGEVVLVSRLRAALEKLNPALPPEAITAAIDELTRDRSAMLLEQANREVYRLLKEGIPVSVADTGESTPHPGPLPGRGGEGGGALGTARPTKGGEGKGGQTTVRVRVIDWEQPANNDFLLVSQFSVTGALYTCRPDLVSPGQNEIPLMKKLGLDIEGHRRRMNDSAPGLDEKFKDTDDPLRLVFVCAMWLTGFDAPSCSTVYLDKPMRNHTLMQTIARANRVFPGKHSGMIVDYANVFASLEKALAIYGAGKGGANPVKDKAKLVADLRRAIDAATAFCAARQVILPAIEQLNAGSLQRLQKVADAVDALISPDPLRREFIGHERIVNTLYGAVKPDPAALEFAGRVATLAAIADAIRATLNPNPADITEVMGDIAKLLDASITGVDMPAKPAPVMDLSKIDFEALRSRFKEAKHKNTDLEVLKAAIRAQLEKLIRLNKTRADFAEKFEELIESYNTGSRNIEELFEELVKLSRNLSEEQQRHVRENMTEEELVIFDILTRPAPELSADERAEVKKVARDLLNRLKQLLVLNWRQKSGARASLKLAIEDTLDTGLPRAYDKPLYEQKCSALFEHIYESYPEREAGVYSEAM